MHATDEWLVFPHEMEGLARVGIAEHKRYLLPVKDALDGVVAPVKLKR